MANSTTSVKENDHEVQADFELSQNYPNPFNPETTISYKVQAASNVSLKVYDVLGREVATLVDEYQQAGTYNSQFLASRDASRSGSIINFQLTSGIYFYTLTAGTFSDTKKMILLR
jgi:hypothetical protein